MIHLLEEQLEIITLGKEYLGGVRDNVSCCFYDRMSEPIEFKQTMDYIQAKYTIVNRNCTKSGSHDDFHNFVPEKEAFVSGCAS